MEKHFNFFTIAKINIRRYIKKLNYKINGYINTSSTTMEATDSKKETLFVTNCTGLIKINKDQNVDKFLKTGTEYYMYLPKSDRLIHVKCLGIGFRAADLQILSTIKNGKQIRTDEGAVFGYQYENFDAVHFDSFKFRETCELYKEEPIYTLRHMDALCSVDL